MTESHETQNRKTVHFSQISNLFITLILKPFLACQVKVSIFQYIKFEVIELPNITNIVRTVMLNT